MTAAAGLPTASAVRVVAVGGEQAVAVGQRVDGADRGRLLADRQVAVAADPGARVLLLGALLEAADQCHLLEQPPGRGGVQPDGEIGLGGTSHKRELYRQRPPDD